MAGLAATSARFAWCRASSELMSTDIVERDGEGGFGKIKRKMETREAVFIPFSVTMTNNNERDGLEEISRTRWRELPTVNLQTAMNKELENFMCLDI